jgi:pimeloyl-ACP methyl ester carboxylesterase
MISRTYKKLNPVIGFFRACGRYLISSSNDVFYPNPHFNPASENISSIYCVHGTADRSGAFLTIKDKLFNHEPEHLPENIKGIYLLVFDERLKGASIKVFSNQLNEKIKLNNDNNIILMGHSRGALVSSWFAENLAADSGIHVDTIVSICGPFKGSPVAIWPLSAWSDSVAEMQVESDFLDELNPKILASTVRYLFIGATSDFLVWRDAWHPYAADAVRDNLFCRETHAHLSILTSNEIITWLLARFAENREELLLELNP